MAQDSKHTPQLQIPVRLLCAQWLTGRLGKKRRTHPLQMRPSGSRNESRTLVATWNIRGQKEQCPRACLGFFFRDFVIVDYFFFFYFLFNIKVQPINNVVVISGEQQRDSAIHIHVSILCKLPSHPGFQITLSRVPCALKQV